MEKFAETITFEDVVKVDIRVGTVKKAERVEKSDKLLRLEVDFGEPETRVVLSGIGKTWKPEDVLEKQYAFIVNLPPRKMMGQESHAMILAAGELTELALCGFNLTVPNGTRVG